MGLWSTEPLGGTATLYIVDKSFYKEKLWLGAIVSTVQIPFLPSRYVSVLICINFFSIDIIYLIVV